jgi:hypothetical protein
MTTCSFSMFIAIVFGRKLSAKTATVIVPLIRLKIDIVSAKSATLIVPPNHAENERPHGVLLNLVCCVGQTFHDFHEAESGESRAYVSIVAIFSSAELDHHRASITLSCAPMTLSFGSLTLQVALL